MFVVVCVGFGVRVCVCTCSYACVPTCAHVHVHRAVFVCMFVHMCTRVVVTLVGE